MKKITLLAMFVGVLFFLLGCARWHYEPLNEGIYQSNEDLIEMGDLQFESIKFVMEEITKDEFLQANGVDVIEDLATPSHERKYYSIKLYMKILGMDYIQYALSGATSGGTYGMRDEYKLYFDYTHEEVVYPIKININFVEVAFSGVPSYSSGWIRLKYSPLTEGDEQ
jgi:hypothetical protein